MFTPTALAVDDGLERRRLLDAPNSQREGPPTCSRHFVPLLPLLLPGRPKRPAGAGHYRAKPLKLLVSALGLEPRTY